MEIVNYCANPPRGLERQLRRSLRWIDEADLLGLAVVALRDEMSVVTANGPKWAQEAEANGVSDHIGGWYSPAKAEVPAYVMLYVQNIYRTIPSWLWWSTVPTLRIVRTLAHEVAHHLKATRGYVNQPGEETEDEESLADSYAEKVLQKMVERWPYRLGQRYLKERASWHYAFGSLDWRDQKYEAAANRFLDAWNLDPSHKSAAYWYWRAKEMRSTKPE